MIPWDAADFDRVRVRGERINAELMSGIAIALQHRLNAALTPGALMQIMEWLSGGNKDATVNKMLDQLESDFRFDFDVTT